MKHVLTLLSGRAIPLSPVYGEHSVLVPGVDCQGCGKPLRVRGAEVTTTTSADHRVRTHTSMAIEACHALLEWPGARVHHVGTMTSVDEDTFFGFDEDDAVLGGRPRVYGGWLR